MIEESSLLIACSALVKRVGFLLDDMFIRLDTLHLLQSTLGHEYRHAKDVCEAMVKEPDKGGEINEDKVDSGRN